jgi:dihydroorotase
MELLIKNAKIIDYAQDFTGDIYIKDGIIDQIGKNLNVDCKVIDAKGKTVMPAFVDLHVHFRDPGLTHKEDIESGSRAAVHGGYTTVNLMPNTKPACSSMETVNYVLNRAKQVGLVDVHQCMTITKDLAGEDISHLDEIDTNVVKFITDDGKGVKDMKVMLNALYKAKEKNVRIMCHAESPEFSGLDMRLAEDMMTMRDIQLAKYADAPLHLCHVSTKQAMKAIMFAKLEGQDITCEVGPHHLMMTSEEGYRVNPPLREQDDVAVLIEAIKQGYVDAIATDHAPHTLEDKKNGSPGISGIEVAFATCYTKLVKEGHITLNKLSDIMSKRPAEIMGLNKGKICIGYIADLVMVDTDKSYVVDSKNFFSKGKNTPMNGKTLYGEILTTVKMGKIVYNEGNIF